MIVYHRCDGPAAACWPQATASQDTHNIVYVIDHTSRTKWISQQVAKLLYPTGA